MQKMHKPLKYSSVQMKYFLKNSCNFIQEHSCHRHSYSYRYNFAWHSWPHPSLIIHPWAQCRNPNPNPLYRSGPKARHLIPVWPLSNVGTVNQRQIFALSYQNWTPYCENGFHWCLTDKEYWFNQQLIIAGAYDFGV